MTEQQGGMPDPDPDPGDEDATRMVSRPTQDSVEDDATRAVARPAADPVDEDATRVVARPAQDPVDDDATRAVPRAAAEPVEDDATRAVARPATDPVDEDATRAVARPDILKPVRPEPSASGGPHTVTRTGSTTGSRNPAPPVEEPQVTNVSRDVAALMFKSPLDPRRRVRNTSVPGAEGAEPRQGVSRGIPVVYGPRATEALQIGVAAAPSAPAAIGAIPPAAERNGLPSTARINRRERVVTLVGGAVLVAASITGLWWISIAAFG